MAGRTTMLLICSSFIITGTDLLAVTSHEKTAKQNFTREEAFNLCTQRIRESNIVRNCLNVLKADDIDTSVKDCALDVAASGATFWIDPILKSLSEACKLHYLLSVPVNESLPKEIIEDLCTVNCGENGKCNLGRCVCDDGFAGEACDISVDTVPSVAMTTSLWDLQDSSRGGVTITGSGFFNSSLITCFLTYQVDNSVQLTSLPAVYDSDVVVYCPIPINGNLSIQIANDGRRGSVGSAEVYSYNSSCQDCSQNPGNDVRCSTKENKCMIKDACFDEADLDPGDSCYVCASKVSTATWTRKLDESCRQTNVWVFIWPSLLGIFLLLGTFSAVFLVRKYEKSGTYDLGKVQAKFEMGVFTITHSAQTQ